MSLGNGNHSSVTVECAMFTFLKHEFSEEEDIYRCYYSAWAYSLFALVGLLLVVLPFFLVLCCILRKRSKRQQYRSYTRSESTYSHDYESPREPLTPCGEVFTNYGAVERHSHQDESHRGPSNHQQENESTTSSHTSLLANYDETSLNFRNALLNRNQSLSPNGKSASEQQSSNPLDYRTNSQQPGDSGLYATADLVPDSVNRTDRNKTSGTKPIYDVLEGPEPDDATQLAGCKGLSQQVHQAHPNSKTLGAEEAEDNNLNSHVDGNLPVYAVLDGPSPENEPVPAVTEEKVAVDEEMPHYAVLEPPVPENLKPGDRTEIPVNETHVAREDDLQKLSTDLKTNPSDPVDISEDGYVLPVDSKPNAHQIEPLKTTGEREGKCTPPPSPKQTDSPDPYSKGEDTDILSAKQQRKRLESRTEYEMFLLEKVNKLPENQRQGCYLIRDSLTSSGCKVLTMYAVEPNSEKTLFNFKVCIDRDGSVYLGKSKRKFPTLDALLVYLRINKDMLPCTITRQFLTEQAVDHLYEEVAA